MTPTELPERIAQMAEITRMERGRLSIIRTGPDGLPYFNLQHREDGRNVSEYIRRDQVPVVREHLAAGERFQQLVDEHISEISEISRQERKADTKKKTPDTTRYALAQEEEIAKLTAAFRSAQLGGAVVADLEKLLRTAIFKPAVQLVGELLQEAADKIDAAYRPKPGEIRKGRHSLEIQGIFGTSTLRRDYYYHPGKKRGRHPADAALGLEGSHTPALSRLICLEHTFRTPQSPFIFYLQLAHNKRFPEIYRQERI